MHRILIVAVIALICATGCSNYSCYPIDDRPRVKVDPLLLGIWKCKEDTVGDFFLVQEDIDCTTKEMMKQYKFHGYEYYVTYFNRGGINPFLQQWNVSSCFIGKEQFLNIASAHILPEHEKSTQVDYFIFERIVHLSPGHDSMTVATVADTTLKYLVNSAEVRSRISYKMKEPSFYKDTIHLYKVSNYHASLNEAVKIAHEH